MTCVCDRPHYPLRFFRKGTAVLATRGTKPVENVLGDGRRGSYEEALRDVP